MHQCPRMRPNACAKEGLNKFLLVIPAQAGIQPFHQIGEELDPSLRWDDGLFRGFLSVAVA
jgi:hypothetical protein